MRTRAPLRPDAAPTGSRRLGLDEHPRRGGHVREVPRGHSLRAGDGGRRALGTLRSVVAFMAAVLLILVVLMAVGLLLTPDPSVEPLPMPEPVVQTLDR
jgi:hypothetical protein